MRILISNDDGVTSPGIIALAQAAAHLGEVFVVAPDRQRSASSHGISLHRTLYAKRRAVPAPVAEAWAVSGTPVDCVKWGLYYYKTQGITFDLMLSGVNQGYNLATDVLYSGTVAAAGEASLQGIPAIALSLGGTDDFQFEAIAKACKAMIPRLYAITLPSDTFLSVNFPTGGHVDGNWMATRLGARGYRDYFVTVRDEQGNVGYRYRGEELLELHAVDTDTACVQQGNISVTPLRYRFTNDEFIGSLKAELMKILK